MTQGSSPAGADGRAGPGPLAAYPPWLDRAVAVLAVVFVAVAIGTPLLGLTVFAGTDLMMERPPWSYLVPTGFVPQNPYVGDTVDGFLPATHEFVERLRHGDFAQWWPYNSGGAQLASVPSPAVLSPLSLPYLLLPLEIAPAYVKLLETVVAVGGMYLFLRRLHIAKAAAVLGGLVFVSSGFMIAWTNWPQTRVAAFIPGLFWAIERLVQRRRPGDVALLAAVVAAMLLGGFPAVTWYALVAAGVYCLVRVLVAEDRPPTSAVPAGKTPARPAERSHSNGAVPATPTPTTRAGRAVRAGRVGALAAGGVLLGLGVAAAQLLPFLQELGAVATGDRSQGAGAHSPVESLVLTVAPDAFGGTNLRQHAVEWFGPSHPVEEMSYVGAAALVLAALAVVARRRPGLPRGVRGYFAVAAVATVILIFVGGPLLAAVQQLPVFADNRIGRARAVLGLFFAVLAAIGFDALLRAPAERAMSAVRRRGWRSASAVFAVALLGCALGVVFVARRYAYSRQQPDYFHGSLLRAAAFGVIAAAVVGLAAYRGRGVVRNLALLGIPALVAVQALTVVLPFWPRVSPEQFYPETPTHAFLAANLDGERVVTADAMMTGTEAFYGLRTTGGRGFIAENYDDLLRAGCAECFVSPTFVTGPADPRAFDADVLDRLGTRYLVTDPAAPVPGAEEVIAGGSDRVELVPGRPLEVTLPVGSLRAVGVVAAGASAPTDPYARLNVVLRDAAGGVLVDTDRRLAADSDGGPVLAAIPEEVSAAAITATVTLLDDEPLAVRGLDGVAGLLVVRPVDDGLRVVQVGGATVYERLTALPRIRWASSAAVEPDQGAAGRLLTSGLAPGVVLTSSGPAPSGRPATIEVVEDGGDAVEVVVEADGSGYLVIADGIQDRWSAQLDGAPAALRAADIGVVAVEVPEGRHVVRVEYDPPAGGAGYVLTALAGAVVLGLGAADRWGGPVLRSRRHPRARR